MLFGKSVVMVFQVRIGFGIIHWKVGEKSPFVLFIDTLIGASLVIILKIFESMIIESSLVVIILSLFSLLSFLPCGGFVGIASVCEMKALVSEWLIPKVLSNPSYSNTIASNPCKQGFWYRSKPLGSGHTVPYQPKTGMVQS